MARLDRLAAVKGLAQLGATLGRGQGRARATRFPVQPPDDGTGFTEQAERTEYNAHSRPDSARPAEVNATRQAAIHATPGSTQGGVFFSISPNQVPSTCVSLLPARAGMLTRVY